MLILWQQRSHVPKFGNWENEKNVPYTAYFDKARIVKVGGKMINPNDPQQNPDMFPVDPTPVKAPVRTRVEPEVQVGQGMARPKHENRSTRETDSPSRHENPTGRRTSGESYHQQRSDGVSSGETPKRSARQTGGYERSIDQSPLHPHYQAKTGVRSSGVASPSWDRKSSENNHGVAPKTPERSRMRSPDQAAAVPKFGEWDENDPASADGFTGIFNKVRQEKQTGMANVITMPTSTPNRRNQAGNDNSKTRCCFL
ncbi:Pathogenic type III effector avirulence factor Avr cleavage site [Macleaya cordata]|uniref:Pathogenic type III effector avirulence factor Avr cleavage site n=1 Tax=Macleaya cordata TaxID=56857 RepID=A0A200Q6W5_MACCD|nr:Pathogenic type III effector avirulence factor Avr cleavage site [Macleaya cordata]